MLKNDAVIQKNYVGNVQDNAENYIDVTENDKSNTHCMKSEI